MKRPPPKEAQVEAACRALARKAGGRLDKFVSPANRSVPDRLLFMPKGKLVLVELKREGRKPTKLQLYTHKVYRGLGFRVEVIDNVEDFKDLLAELVKG